MLASFLLACPQGKRFEVMIRSRGDRQVEGEKLMQVCNYHGDAHWDTDSRITCSLQHDSVRSEPWIPRIPRDFGSNLPLLFST